MRRVVFDSTILISAFLRPGGLSDELLGLAGTERLRLVLSVEIIEESRQKLLGSRRIRRRYAYRDRDLALFFDAVAALAETLREVPSLSGVVRDPNDDMVVGCAVQGKADAIVTRDKDLL